MVTATETSGGSRGQRWRILGWGFAAALLLAPLVAMQFTREVQWDETDFLVFGLMLLLAGSGFEALARARGPMSYRLAGAAAVITAFLTIWVNLAVGMIGSEDNGYNLLFFGILLLVLAGATLVGFRSKGMAIVMALAGFAQAAVALGGLPHDPRGSVFSLMFALPWLTSAALFGVAARSAP